MQSKRGRARGHVMHADIAFAPGADTRAPGGAVTVALCGSYVVTADELDRCAA